MKLNQSVYYCLSPEVFSRVKGSKMKSDEKRFSASLVVRYPPRLAPLLDIAAERKCMTTSQYVRQSIVQSLKADGLEFGEAKAGA